MSVRELYVKGAHVWIPDQEQVWRCAELTQDYKNHLVTVIFEDGQTQEIKVKSDEELPPLRNPEILIGENDLTSLSYLHEPAVLYNLQVRFCNQNAIYTYCGIVLVAINPYEELPIYGPDTISAYRGHSMGDLDPHIFAVAEEAFTQMERDNKDQSIIVSGESGAGKTVSAKYAMRYFASVGGSDSETQIEKKILASNPIMEAIGNAKTTRNDNSSRFGKYIELDFTRSYSIMGANMRTYLLEKSRVVFQAPEERNYHIFYQLCSAASDKKYSHLRLGPPETFHYMNQGLQEDPTPPRRSRPGHQDNFHYLNQGSSPSIEGVDDGADFIETCKALSLLGINEATQDQMFRILAGILHLGNIVIEDNGGDASAIDKGDESLAIVAELLGISASELKMWLCHRKITSGREVFTKPVTLSEATFSRDALAKHIYAKLFDWIVKEINKCFAAPTKPFRFIGVLDIYGFETFEINSFEQFCINYANEKLQQQFNQHVFKLEQEEYVKEQIEWEFINFYDNQPCIDLIESKLGILDLLDEECRMPKGSDQSWVEKLYDKCKKWDHFSKPRLSNTSFLIAHFADKVGYECAGFLEKNRDTVSEEQINLLKSSQISLVHALFTVKAQAAPTKVKVLPTGPSAAHSSKQMKKSVGSQFRDSLNLLMLTLNSTTPHYVRCIKPNDDKMAFTFDPTRAIQQLRACGVLETVRISAAGYPSRWTYHEFFCRYRVLCTSRDIVRNDMRLTCEKIIANMITDEDKFKFGRTKIFFRAGQVAYMEKLRADRLSACGIMIQKHVRMYIHRNRFRTMRNSAIIIQKYARGMAARRLAHHMRQTAAAIKIQACVRGWVKRVQYRRLVYTITHLQAHARGCWARQRYQHMRRDRAAIVIQKHVRRWLTRRRYLRAMRGFVIVQGLVRCFLARRQLKKLKIEAKSIEHQKKLNKGLENKIISLQQKLTELKNENNFISSYKEEIMVLKTRVTDLKGVEKQLKVSNNQVNELEARIAELTKELEMERGEKMDVLTQKERAEKENRELIEKLNEENARLTKELSDAQKEETKRETEEYLRRKFEAEKQQLILENTDEKSGYQRLLKEFNRLEQKNEHLEEELAKFKGGNAHKRTASNVSNLSGASDAPTELVHDDASEFSSFPGDDDVGYGSVRSRSSEMSDSNRNLENIEWSSQKTGDTSEIKIQVPQKMEDITLVLQLQNKVRELEKERRNLSKQIDHLESSSPPDDPQHAQELIRLQELEMENAKLKDDLNRLRKSIADSEPQNNRVQEFMKQFEALQDELERRREECIQLRTVLANRAHDLRSVTQTSYGKDVDIVNEDGELVLAYQTQKQVNRQLEDELKKEKQRLHETEADYKGELERLRRDNERQQKLLAQNLCKSDSTNSETLLQSEIMRLTSENLNLQGQVDNLTEQLKKYKRSLRAYAKKLKEAGGGDPTDMLDVNTTNEGEVLPIIRKKEREYMGMFEYDRRDEMQIIRVLVYELKPRVAVTLLPGLPAYILFMCIRHTDHINDDEKVRSLLNNIVNGVKRVIKKRHEDLDSTVLWLSNVLRLLHNLKQYSGDKAFQAENTVKQNEQSLKNFDLSEYRQVLSDIAVWIYNGVIKLMEEKVQPLIVPSILEHEAIAGLSGNKPGGMRGRTGSVARELESPVEPQKALDLLLKEMTQFYRTLAMFGTDPELITQVFRQIFYFICAGSLNNLLLRKDMCHWSKGMQIRYNLSHLEQWTRDMRLHESGVTDTLAPIIQAAQLLQARKTDDDVHSICDMCDKLSVSQIIKILNLYTPADEFEERVPISFIHKIQAKLQERAEGEQAQATLLMNTKFAFPVRFPFTEYGYVWFLPRWFNTNWYNTSIYSGKDRKRLPCTTTQMLEAIDRHMSLGFAYYAPDNATSYENLTVAEWREEYRREMNNTPPDYAGYTYDAVWAYALALDKLLKEDRTHVSNFHTFRTVERFSEIISKTSFSGVSGMINFRKNSSDPHNNISDTQLVNIMQFVVDDDKKGGSYVTVGTFNPQGSKLDLDLGDLRFLQGIPKDGLVEDTCLFETFSRWLNVECDQAIIIVMVLIFVVFAFILIALFIVYKRRFEKMIPESGWSIGELMPLDEWELPREKVVINRTIGEGAFGTVFGGECQFADNSPWLAVAVKTLKVGSTVEEKLDFLGEAEMMKRFNHRNIVQLLGLCTHQEPIYMVMEFMLYGDLKTYLLARRHLVSDRTVHSEEDEINSKRLTSMALDVCCALAYLAELKYVHRDVACRNCLVSAERVVKLSDFGMTRPMYESDYYRFNRRGMLPVRWMSPESLEDGIFTSSSDMWSYGVLLYEIITFGSFPFQGMSNNQVLEHVRSGNTISLPKSVKPQLERLLLSCWSMNPQHRPTFTEMGETLNMWPRLITPCLELPTAAIQINDTDSVDLALPTDQPCRRSSAPNTRLPTTRPRLADADSCTNNNATPNCVLQSRPGNTQASNLFGSFNWNHVPQENGGGPSKEPLLPQNGEAYVTRYVCLQRTKSGENSELESPSSMTAV